MNNNGNSVVDAKMSSGKEVGFIGVLHIVMLLAIIVGALGSLAFMFHAGQQTPRLLLVAFTVWILAPFAFLFWANRLATRWSIPTRIILYIVAILISVGSLAVYSGLVDVKPAGSANAFLFVAVPPVSLVVSVLTIGLARLMSGRRSHT
jgi:hypothetical protein